MPDPDAPDGRPQLLVLRALALGDLLVSVPALRALRRGFPGHRLVLATSGWLGPAVDLIGGIDALLPASGLGTPLPRPAGGVDVAVNLHGRGPESHALLDRLEPRRRIGFAAPGWDGPVWHDDVHERVRWAGLVAAYGIPADPDDVGLVRPDPPSPAPGAVVLHVGAGYVSRAWPSERFAAVARALAAQGHRVVLSGGDGERDRALAVAGAAGISTDDVLAGRTSLPHSPRWSPRPPSWSRWTPAPPTWPAPTAPRRWCSSGRHRWPGGARPPPGRTSC